MDSEGPMFRKYPPYEEGDKWEKHLSKREKIVLERPIGVGGDLWHLKEELYKPLIKYMREENDPNRIARKLDELLDEYYQNSEEKGGSPLIGDLQGRADRFVDALLSDVTAAEDE
ncbi:MAG: hypothetical protein NUV59_02900 [Patescibacteria group bacterium]|nr:hypothetical protein [Patescibacteria group bacterium]